MAVLHDSSACSPSPTCHFGKQICSIPYQLPYASQPHTISAGLASSHLPLDLLISLVFFSRKIGSERKGFVVWPLLWALQSIESELKRRALKGREEKVRAFEEKLQRNRVRSATMKNRIHESREQFEDFCRQKHVAILQSLDRSSVQRDRLVSARSVKVAAGQVQREALHRQRLRDVLVGQEAYCDSKMEKIVANGTKLEQMKAAKRRAQKEWLDAQRAEIYDHFMKNEILIDTLNCKKIREDFAGMLMQSYPIVERRPQTSR